MDAAVFGRLVDRYLLRLRPGRTLKGVLLEFMDADVKAEDLARVITSNAFYEELLVKSFRNLEKVLVTAPAELEVASLVWARSVLISEAAMPLVLARAGVAAEETPE